MDQSQNGHELYRIAPHLAWVTDHPVSLADLRVADMEEGEIDEGDGAENGEEGEETIDRPDVELRPVPEEGGDITEGETDPDTDSEDEGTPLTTFIIVGVVIVVVVLLVFISYQCYRNRSGAIIKKT